jgi:hypothetical protein
MSQEIKFNGKIHPIADLWPMMSDEELEALATDIKANGLAEAIILDQEGTLVDGRNRLAACKIADLKPRFLVLDGQDPVAFIFSHNAHRRHMKKGQLAILGWKAYIAENQISNFEKLPRGAANKVKELSGANADAVSMGLLILRHAPDLADKVVTGLPFDQALQRAKDNKLDSESLDRQMDLLRKEAPDYAELVAEERLKINEALAAMRERKEQQKRDRQHATELLRDVIQVLDPRASDPKVHAENFITNFDPNLCSEEITKDRIEQCLLVLRTIAKAWKEENHVIETRN